MKNLLQPTWALNSIYELTPRDLKFYNIKNVFADLDNTLIEWDNKESTDKLKNFATDLYNNDINLIILSNNNRDRIKKALKGVPAKFVAKARKPLPFKLNKAITQAKINKDQTIMVGDQFLTDIVAGNLANIKTVLVKPLVNTDSSITKFNRTIENTALKGIKANIKWNDFLE